MQWQHNYLPYIVIFVFRRNLKIQGAVLALALSIQFCCDGERWSRVVSHKNWAHTNFRLWVHLNTKICPREKSLFFILLWMEKQEQMGLKWGQRTKWNESQSLHLGERVTKEPGLIPLFSCSTCYLPLTLIFCSLAWSRMGFHQCLLAFSWASWRNAVHIILLYEGN